MTQTNYNDWLSRGRENQLKMAKNWITVLTGQGPEKWNIPGIHLQALEDLTREAGNALSAAKASEERTAALNALCRDTFDALTVKMKDIAKNYFLKPPLTDADFASLGLPHPDSAPVLIPVPTAQPVADLTFPGPHLVGLINIRAVAGNPPDAQSDYGVRMFWGLTGTPTETDKFRVTQPPQSGGDLPHSKFTRRKKELFGFDGEKGNTVYFCLRYESPAGQAGPFGSILSAVIP